MGIIRKVDILPLKIKSVQTDLDAYYIYFTMNGINCKSDILYTQARLQQAYCLTDKAFEDLHETS